MSAHGGRRRRNAGGVRRRPASSAAASRSFSRWRHTNGWERHVERERAGVGAWYEFFPRSEGARLLKDGTVKSGTFRTASRRIPAVAAMGFDVLYLPPIHPIGTVNRKGRNNTLDPGPADPG